MAVTLPLEFLCFPTDLAWFILIEQQRICWFKRKYHSETNLSYIWLVRKRGMMPDVEVTRTFHPSFPSSFNISLAAVGRMMHEGWNNSRHRGFIIACASDTVAEELQHLHLASCRLLLSQPGNILSPPACSLPRFMLLPCTVGLRLKSAAVTMCCITCT